jgi:hypothetical protein
MVCRRLVVGALALAIVALGVSAPVAGAQEPVPTLARLGLSIWPEFDRQAVLVIYRGEFVAETSLPLSVEILIPAEAGEPSAVAYRDEQGNLLTLSYTTELRGDQRAVQFELPTLAFQLEYYNQDWLSSLDGGRRQFTFSLTPGYAIQTFSLDILQPVGATDFSVSPPADETVTDANGLTYAVVDRTDVPAGETLAWEIGYDKADSELVLPPTAAVPPPASTSGTDAGNSSVVAIVLGVVAVALVGGGAYWLGRRQVPPARRASPQQGPSGRSAKKGPAARPRVSPEWREVEGTPFCHKCGTRLKAEAEFCHQCGTRVKHTR